MTGERANKIITEMPGIIKSFELQPPTFLHIIQVWQESGVVMNLLESKAKLTQTQLTLLRASVASFLTKYASAFTIPNLIPYMHILTHAADICNALEYSLYFYSQQGLEASNKVRIELSNMKETIRKINIDIN